MSVRGILIFCFALLLVRAGDRRIFGKNSAFDIVLGIILGSILSRAITGNSPFVPTAITSAVLIALHWIFARLAQQNHTFGKFIKGNEILMVKDGQMQKANMHRTNITEQDLLEILRSTGKITQIDAVQEAYLERSGNISVVPRKEED
jgi:uncharacterized membrane protein YcaP (DUF421 family)